MNHLFAACLFSKKCLVKYKFEPESFIDSLLGIGLGSSKDEGKELALRLSEMRKERNARAKTVTKTTPIKVGEGVNPAGQLSFNPMDDEQGGNGSMQLITAGGDSTRGSSSKNKSKKKKKKKNKR